MEEEAKARYVDLRARLARMQESLDVLNEKSVQVIAKTCVRTVSPRVFRL
jgi:hypothetical protein